MAIVGSGLLGSATAWALGARGVPALLLEQFSPGHARGSSHGATRIFRLSHPEPDYVRMAVLAGEAWARLAAQAGEDLVITTGGLDTGPAAGDCAAALRECGVEHSWLSASEVRGRFPGIAVRPGERMLFQPDSGVCLADRAVAALQRLARRAGVPVRPQTPVLGIEPRGDRVVLRTPAGRSPRGWPSSRPAPGPTACWPGPWPALPRLTATLQQVRYFTPHEGSGPWPTLIEWPDARPCWYVVPAVGDAPGVKVAAHVPGPAVDPRDGPFTGIDQVLEDEAAGYVRDRLPGLKPAGLSPETCLYTMTADEDFVLDRDGPVVVGGGCSGHAFKFGPLLGEVLADLALGAEPAIARERFSLRRRALAAAPPG